MAVAAHDVDHSAQLACNAAIDLADQLDALVRYNLPNDITTAASTAQHIADLLKVACQVAFAYHHAIPAPKDALKYYAVDERCDLRAIRRHSLFAFRSGYDAHRSFSDIPSIAHRLRAKTTAPPS
ncbi:hypothetical protein ACFTZB_19360 [Rhodococcus sp. NPDC057014]|uniref:hypothetical protein n=1 Tax=Rhodococcus sp. NPDC057014 TaxID=3346000 RepID=UPI00363868EE